MATPISRFTSMHDFWLKVLYAILRKQKVNNIEWRALRRKSQKLAQLSNTTRQVKGIYDVDQANVAASWTMNSATLTLSPK